MEPIKFEEHLREKLEAREIQPSKDAWSKLEAQLGEEKKRSTKGYWWAIAAGFIGILMVSTLFFTQDVSFGNKNVVVETDASETTKHKKEPIQNSTEIASEEKEITPVGTETIPSEVIQKPKPPEAKKEDRYATNVSKNDADTNKEQTNALKQEKPVAEIGIASLSEQNTSVGNLAAEITRDDLYIENKITEVVAQVQQLKNNNTTITPEEIDALLANAQREIATQRILHQPKVDAAALLQDIEMELEQNFRERVFEALGEGFQKIRTAVVDRNQ